MSSEHLINVQFYKCTTTSYYSEHGPLLHYICLKNMLVKNLMELSTQIRIIVHYVSKQTGYSTERSLREILNKNAVH